MHRSRPLDPRILGWAGGLALSAVVLWILLGVFAPYEQVRVRPDPKGVGRSRPGTLEAAASAGLVDAPAQAVRMALQERRWRLQVLDRQTRAPVRGAEVLEVRAGARWLTRSSALSLGVTGADGCCPVSTAHFERAARSGGSLQVAADGYRTARVRVGDPDRS